jgi:hypothetical protein
MRLFAIPSAIGAILLSSCATVPLWPKDKADRPGPLALVGYESDRSLCDLVLKQEGTGGLARIELGTGAGSTLVGAAAGTYTLEEINCGGGLKSSVGDGPANPFRVVIAGEGIHYLGAYDIRTRKKNALNNVVTFSNRKKDVSLRQLQAISERLGGASKRLVSGFSGRPLLPAIQKQTSPSKLDSFFKYAAGSRDKQAHEKLGPLVDECYKQEQRANFLIVGEYLLRVSFSPEAPPAFSPEENKSTLRDEFTLCLKKALGPVATEASGVYEIRLKSGDS